MRNTNSTILIVFTIALAGIMQESCKSKKELIPHGEHASAADGVRLNDLLKPTNEFVLSKVPVTTLNTGAVIMKTEVLGRIAYDTREIGTISSRVSGRIEHLYVRYRYQKISAGQKIMDIYSPELLTYQQNLIFLLAADPTNTIMITATKERLLVNGMSQQQLSDIIRTRQPSNTVSIYSNYSGHIHEAASQEMPAQPSEGGMKDLPITTEALNLKEGMYVEKGKTVFDVYNPDRAWVLLQLYADQQGAVERGNNVIIVPEAAPEKRFEGMIDFIEPFFRKENRTVSARVYFNNVRLRIPIGSQITAIVSSGSKVIDWLPEAAVVSLGRDKVVFKKNGRGFVAKRVVIGIRNGGRVEVTSGLQPTDTVASNGQFLMDSESFIKVSE